MNEPKLSDAYLQELQVDQLINLEERLERLIARRIEAEKRQLIEKLRVIEGLLQSRQRERRPPLTGEKKPRVKLAPKYRNPITGETWAGRGMLPRWLKEATKGGNTKEDFLISDAAWRRGIVPGTDINGGAKRKAAPVGQTAASSEQ